MQELVTPGLLRKCPVNNLQPSQLIANHTVSLGIGTSARCTLDLTILRPGQLKDLDFDPLYITILLMCKFLHNSCMCGFVAFHLVNLIPVYTCPLVRLPSAASKHKHPKPSGLFDQYMPCSFPSSLICTPAVKLEKLW